MSGDEEYEPGGAVDSYTPATTQSQSEEYTPSTNGNSECAYKPSVAFIQSNYVPCFELKNGTDSGFDKQSESSGSGKALWVTIFVNFHRHRFGLRALARACQEAKSFDG